MLFVLHLRLQHLVYWYFDSDFSCHVTEDKSFFTTLIFINNRYVTFRYGSKAMICGKWSNSSLGILEHKDFFYMEDLKTNLINISQICDTKCLVKFTCKEWTIYENSRNVMVKGTNSKDNCSSVGNLMKLCTTF